MLEPLKENAREQIHVYVTLKGVPIFNLPKNTQDETYVMMSGFLHAIDIFANKMRKNTIGARDFLGFALGTEIEVSVMEVVSEADDGTTEAVIDLEEPYGATFFPDGDRRGDTGDTGTGNSNIDSDIFHF